MEKLFLFDKIMRLVSSYRVRLAFVHFAVPAMLSVCFLLVGLLNIYRFYSVNDLDYGLFSNLLWNLANGNGWRVSLYIGQDRLNFLADHLSLLAPFVSVVFKFFPSAYTLSVLHHIAFAAVFFLTPFLVRVIWQEEKGKGSYLLPACIALAILVLNRGFLGAWLFQSHMTTLSMPFILGALIALHKKSWWIALLLCIPAILAQERGALAVFGVGMYALLVLRQKKLGAAVCCFAGMYFVAAVVVIIPMFQSAGYMYASMLDPFYEPLTKITYVLLLAVSWLLLPLLGRRAFLAALCITPELGVALMSNRDHMFTLIYQYQDMASMFLLAASTHGLVLLSNIQGITKYMRRALLFLGPIIIIVAVAMSGPAKISRFLEETFFISPEIVALNKKLDTYNKDIPADVHVYATSIIGPRLSLRKHRYHITLARAQEGFANSIVFMSPYLDIVKRRKELVQNRLELQAALDNNPDLQLIAQDDLLRVYASKDISHTTHD